MAKFQMKTLIDPYVASETARLGAGTGTANWVSDAEVGKLVKKVADSRYDLCAAGDPIQGQVVAVESARSDDYSIGSVKTRGRMDVVLDGLEATPGTGAIAIGDYVVCGTVVAKATALSAAPKVVKATNQPGVAFVSTVADADTAAAVKTKLDLALVAVADAANNALHAWRLISASGTAVGSTGVIERVL